MKSAILFTFIWAIVQPLFAAPEEMQKKIGASLRCQALTASLNNYAAKNRGSAAYKKMKLDKEKACTLARNLNKKPRPSRSEKMETVVYMTEPGKPVRVANPIEAAEALLYQRRLKERGETNDEPYWRSRALNTDDERQKYIDSNLLCQDLTKELEKFTRAEKRSSEYLKMKEGQGKVCKIAEDLQEKNRPRSGKGPEKTYIYLPGGELREATPEEAAKYKAKQDAQAPLLPPAPAIPAKAPVPDQEYLTKTVERIAPVNAPHNSVCPGCELKVPDRVLPYEECTDSSSLYLERQLADYYSNPGKKDLLVSTPGPNDIKPECIISLMKYHKDGTSFGACEGKSGRPELGSLSRAPCISKTYFNHVYSAFTNVMNCFGLSQMHFAALLANESSFHVNVVARSIYLDAGLSQLTASFIEEMNKNYFDSKKDEIFGSGKSSRYDTPACKKIEPYFNKIRSSNSSRCEAITVPENPTTNLIYMAIGFDQNRSQASEFINKIKFPPSLAGEKDRVITDIALLMHNKPLADDIFYYYVTIFIGEKRLKKEHLDFTKAKDNNFLAFFAKYYPTFFTSKFRDLSTEKMREELKKELQKKKLSRKFDSKDGKLQCPKDDPGCYGANYLIQAYHKGNEMNNLVLAPKDNTPKNLHKDRGAGPCFSPSRF